MVADLLIDYFQAVMPARRVGRLVRSRNKARVRERVLGITKIKTLKFNIKNILFVEKLCVK